MSEHRHRQYCRHCDLPAKDHGAEKQCLFAPAKFQPMTLKQWTKLPDSVHRGHWLQWLYEKHGPP